MNTFVNSGPVQFRDKDYPSLNKPFLLLFLLILFSYLVQAQIPNSVSLRIVATEPFTGPFTTKTANFTLTQAETVVLYCEYDPERDSNGNILDQFGYNAAYVDIIDPFNQNIKSIIFSNQVNFQSENISLNPGTYTLKIRTAKDNTAIYASVSYTAEPTCVPVGTPTTPSGLATRCQGPGIETYSSSASAALSYNWELNPANAGSITGNGGTATVTWNAAFSGQAAVSVTAYGCNGSSSSSFLTVNTTALPEIPVITTSNSTELCNGGSISLNTMASGTITWYRNGQATGQSGPSITVSAAGNYTASSSNSCGSSVMSNTIAVSTRSTPAVPVISSANGSTQLCNGTSLILNSSDTQNSITWYLDGNLSGSGSSIVAQQAGSYTIMASNSCGTSAASAAISITALPAPLVPVITADQNPQLCNGASLTLSTTAAGIITWYRNGISIDQGSSSISVSTAGEYTATSSNSCSSSAYSNSITISTPSTPAAPVLIAQSSILLCDGASLIISTAAEGTITWYNNGILIGTGGSIKLYVAGNYSATASNSCGTSAFSNTIAVTTSNLPAAPFISSEGISKFEEGKSVLLRAEGADLKWYRDGTEIGAGNTLSISQSGSYTAKSYNECGYSPSSNKLEIRQVQNELIINSYHNEKEIVAVRRIVFTDGFRVTGGASMHAYIFSDSAQVIRPSNENYILSYAPRTEGLSNAEQLDERKAREVSRSIEYFDGLGRPIQNIQIQGSPKLKDLIQPIIYDAFGREPLKYLPYRSGKNDGSYLAEALIEEEDFYRLPTEGITRTDYPYAQTKYEASPLNKILEQGAPGADWQLSAGHTVKTDQLSNAANEVLLWTITADGASTSNTYYPANKLSKTVTKDENWTSGRSGTSEAYKDKEGNTLLKRIWESESSALNTYYIYDEYNNLRYVLPPAITQTSFTENDVLFSQYSYAYRYDERNRVIQKKIPGKDWEYLVYNTLDQVVATQDGNQRMRNEWTISKYDGLGRTILTGLWNNNNIPMSQANLKTRIYTTTTLWEKRDSGQPNGYTTNSYPQALNTILTISYYDNYTIPNLPASYNKASSYSSKIKGLPTATKTNVLNTASMLWNVSYYDEEGRIVKTISQHMQGGTIQTGNYDETSNSYSFTGELQTSTRSHRVNNSILLTIKTEYAYDHMGRKTQSWETINGGTRTLLAQNNYNEIGQLGSKKLHSEDQGTTFLQTTSYSYNERGWLTQSSSPLFDLKLRYNQPGKGATAQYNGNIAEQEYTAQISGTQWFTYGYDKLNRLTAGNSSEGFSETGIGYEKMGNITTLTRNNYGTLNYTYQNNNQSNQLESVSGFRTGSFTYDANGNTTSDGIRTKNFTYNYLNLPQTISGGTAINYTYDATGRKLRKVSGNVTTDYINGIEYENGVITFVQTEEGRAISSNGTFTYEYTLKDHLGNNRVAFDQFNGSIRKVGEDNYYPFGFNVHRQQNAGNKYLYNGKELQEELDMYDYGFRFYDPQIARWLSPDPLSELAYDWTPFRYAFNNPVRYIDPYGLWESTARGYTTDKAEDIERFFAMMDIEKTAFHNNPSMSQISSFVDGEMSDGGLGTLSDASKLATGFTINAYKQIGGGLKGYAEQKSFNNFWHGIQKDLNPDVSDSRTLGHNLFWTSYAGGNNPKSYRKKDDFSYMPSNLIEYPAIIHDLEYEKLHISGFSGLATSRNAIAADWRFVANELALANDPRVSKLNQFKALGLGVGLGIIAAPKTLLDLTVKAFNTTTR